MPVVVSTLFEKNWTTRTTMKLKRVTITSEMINEFARDDAINNPVVLALKEQHFPDANEIVIHGDELYVDRVLMRPTVQMVRWMNAWNTGRRVEPCILGYYDGI